MERRLAAIVAADIVGYSRLMEADEEGTIARQKAHRAKLIDPIIARHKGRIVKTIGDGLLLEFQSVVDAVRCAVDMQEAITACEADVAEDSRILYRVGVNLGDIVIDGNDILGDGVNVAARLQQLADPGGVLVSEDVVRQAEGKTDISFKRIGERALKNIARPVSLYKVHTGEQRTQAGDLRGAKQSKPTVAVLAFKNLSNDPEQQYFANGITEDLNTGLSRIPDLLVISRDSISVSEAEPLSPSSIHHRFGAQFILEGTVRRAGDRVRINAKLTDATSGLQLWSDRYDRQFDDIFAIQDEVVGSILHALGAADGAIEEALRRRSTPGDAGAYDCYLQGRAHFYQHGDDGFEAAEAFYRKAIELDERFARAYSALAWLHFVRFKLFRTRPFASIRPISHDLAQAALRLDPQDYRAHWVLGGLYLHEGKHRQSVEEFEKALRANPNDANLLAWSAEALVYCGRMEDAIQRCEKAVRLNPNCPDWYYWIKGSAYFHLGRYEDGLAALDLMSATEHAGRLRAATLAHLGRIDEARQEADQFMKLVPAFSISEWAKTEHYADPGELDRYVWGQRQAGLPE